MNAAALHVVLLFLEPIHEDTKGWMGHFETAVQPILMSFRNIRCCGSQVIILAPKTMEITDYPHSIRTKWLP